MTNMQAVPVRIEGGVVRTVDGSPLPEHGNAVLVILPDPSAPMGLEEWQRPFEAFFAAAQQHPGQKLEAVSDAELNALVHAARTGK